MHLLRLLVHQFAALRLTSDADLLNGGQLVKVKSLFEHPMCDPDDNRFELIGKDA